MKYKRNIYGNTYEEEIAFLKEHQKQCKKCGRKIVFRFNTERLICDWCGFYVYKDEKTKFKYELKAARLRKCREVI